MPTFAIVGEEIDRQTAPANMPWAMPLKSYPFAPSLENTINVIADLEPEKFEMLLNEFPKVVNQNKLSLRDHRQLKKGTFVEP